MRRFLVGLFVALTMAVALAPAVLADTGGGCCTSAVAHR